MLLKMIGRDWMQPSQTDRNRKIPKKEESDEGFMFRRVLICFEEVLICFEGKSSLLSRLYVRCTYGNRAELAGIFFFFFIRKKFSIVR